MESKQFIFPTMAAFEIARQMVKHFDLFEQCRIVQWGKYDQTSTRFYLTVEGRSKDLHALEAMSRMSFKSVGWNNSMVFGNYTVGIVRREYEPGKFTNDILVNGSVHSQAVGDALLDEIMDRVVKYVERLS